MIKSTVAKLAASLALAAVAGGMGVSAMSHGHQQARMEDNLPTGISVTGHHGVQY